MQVNYNKTIGQEKLNFKALNCTNVVKIPLVKQNMQQLQELAQNTDITLKASTKKIYGSNIAVNMPAIKIIVEPLEKSRNIFKKIFNLEKFSDKCLIDANEYYGSESFMTIVNRLVNKVSSK